MNNMNVRSQILTERRDLLNLIANTLMKKETLNAQEIEHLRDHGSFLQNR